MKFLPSFLKPLLKILGLTTGILLLARLAMLVLVWDEVALLPPLDIANALYIGTKFDIRIAIFLCLPLAIIFGIPWLERRLDRLRPWLTILYALSMLAIAIVYVVDFGFYFYLHQRVDSTLFDLLPDVTISASMVWESYPVIWITLGVCLVFILFAWLMNHLLKNHRAHHLSHKARAAWTLATTAILFLLAYGQISSNFFPLRWSNAYFSPNQYLVILALNPVQNLRDSYVSRKATQPDIEAVRDAYPRMATKLRITEPDPQALNYWRINPGNPERASRHINVVIILMESLGTPRTSLARGLFAPDYATPDPGPDDPTPILRQLADESIYFPWFFAPTRTTARAVFTSITGVPDVNRSAGTSSRNPALVDQFCIMSEFQGYERFYMIGGSASWANIRGILTYNIPDLHLLEEGAWKAPNVDVWGVSDLALLREAIAYLDTCTKPFVTFIQTAGFHRPWTIPEDNAGFMVRDVPDDVVKFYGFENADEYNSMRFADHALGEFFRLAKTRPWFNNTIFAIMGDHGLNAVSNNVPGGYLACRLQSNHVPLLIYAPGLPDLVTPRIIEKPCGQPDVFPTLAALAGIPYRNHSLGRDLLDPDQSAPTARNEGQFIAGDAEAFIRLLKQGYCYFDENREALYLVNSSGENLLQQDPERAQCMRQEALDTFHTSKYLLFTNKKSQVPPLGTAALHETSQ